MTRLLGMRKKLIALWASRAIQMNNRSRQSAMPGIFVGMSVSRLRKNEVSSMLSSCPQTAHWLNAFGTSGSSLNP